jgi:hypothetical protein
MANIFMAKGTYPFEKTVFVPPDATIVGVGSETLIVPNKGIVAFQGVGNITVTCTKCNYVLVSKVFPNQIQMLAVQCPHCGTIRSIHI